MRFHSPLITQVIRSVEDEWMLWMIALFICRNYADYDSGLNRYNAACLLLNVPIIDRMLVLNYWYAWRS